MAKIIGNTTATPNPQPDWNQTNETKADYIKNKPDIILKSDIVQEMGENEMAIMSQRAISSALDTKEDKTDAETLKKRVSILEQASLGNLYNYESTTVTGSDTIPANALPYAVLGELIGSMKRVVEVKDNTGEADCLVNLDYSKEYIDTDDYLVFNNVRYSPTANGRTGYFFTSNDSLYWEASGDGPYITMSGDALARTSNNIISIIVDVSELAMLAQFRLIDENAKSLVIFKTDASNQVTLRDNTVLTTDGRLRFAVDFGNGIITYFAPNGQTTTTSFTTPIDSNYSNTLEWQQAFTKSVFSFRAYGAGSINIGGIYMYDGDIFTVSKRFEISDTAYIQIGSNKVMIPEEIRALPGYGCMRPSYWSGNLNIVKQPNRVYFASKRYLCNAVKLVLTGEEDMTVADGTATIQNVLVDNRKKSQCWITHGNVINQNGRVETVYAGSIDGDKHLYISDLNATFGLKTEEELRAFLREEYAAGNPVSVIYSYSKTYDISEYLNDEFIEVRAGKEISLRRDDDTVCTDAKLELTYQVKI